MQLLRRSTQVLQAIAENPGGLTLQELVTRLGIPLASMHRLLTALSEDDLVVRSSANRRYVIGPMIHRLATGWNGPPNIAEVTRPHLDRLRREVSETAFVSQLLGDKVVCVALAESTHQLRLFVGVGQEMPLHAAAAARAILAYRPAAFVRQALAVAGLQAFTSETKTDLDAIMRQMPRIRRQGYDVCENEIDHGVWAVAAPIGGVTDQVEASITIAAPKHRVSGPAIRGETISAVQSAAGAISSELGSAWSGLPSVVGT
jgi:DNA-binding IclR family transcriptional regulator